MATIVNARDVLLQAAGTRLVTITLPANTPPDWANIIGGGKPADNADVTVTAVNGGLAVTGGGITLSGGGSIKGGQTDYETGTGFFLGYSGAAYKLSIGSSTNYFKWTGSALTIRGAIVGDSSIAITGSASFDGSYSSGGSVWAVVGNASIGVRGGGRFFGGSTIAGVYATSASGIGVLGETGASSTGVYGKTTGTGGTGTVGEASNSGRALVGYHNTTSGTTAGVGLEITGRSIMGSGGTNDIGLTVTTSGTSSGAAKFFNTGATKEVWLAPGSYAAYSPTGGGKQYFIDGAGPFTGFHPGLGARGLTFTIGDILVDDETMFKPDVSNSLGTMVHSSAPNERGVIGVLSAIGDMPPEVGVEYDYVLWWELMLAYQWLDANAIGEGLVNVCGEGGDIAKGDLIVTSSMPGKGMRQADDIVRSYTVAKAREPMTFLPGEVKQIACIYLCG